MSFALFWHRHGNTPAGVEAVHAAAARGPRALAGRAVAHGVELDLKWAATPSGPLLYAWHGPTGRERLDAGRVRRRAAQGRVALLEALLTDPRARDLRWLIELKTGHGPPAAALAATGDLVRRAGLAGQVWVAASSLLLLRTARQVAPALPRVLFGAAAPGGRCWHRPTTHTLASLAAHGLMPPLAPGEVDLLCPLGLLPASAAEHARRAEAARALGPRYLPGRVTTRAALQALAADARLPGAFVYARAEEWPAT